MTPRPYPKRERQHVVDAGRDKILAAAAEVLNLDDVGAFSVDAGARRAGVTRMLQRRHNDVTDFEIVVPELLLQQEQHTKTIFNVVLGAIASISLIVGGIGIMTSKVLPLERA